MLVDYTNVVFSLPTQIRLLLILTVFHQRLADPILIPASPMCPHICVMRLCVLVFDPSGRGCDRNNVKNDGKKQKQRQDPPASWVRNPATKHDLISAKEKHL